MKYPKSVFLILSAEFCERFAFYTVQTTLSLYLVEILDFSKNMAMTIFHTYLMLIFFFPIMGAVMADSRIGRYRSLLYLSIIYLLGQYLLGASATPWFHLPIREFSILGLFLLAVGTGSLKSCVLSFASDQFDLSKEKNPIPGFTRLFYLVICCGCILSTVISPVLRKDVTCFGLNNCYPLAFLVPSILMTLAVAIYVFGKPLCKITNPEGNIILTVFKCIIHAISRKWKSKEKRDHWLDHADSKFDRQLIEDTKIVLALGKLFALFSVNYSVYFQSHSRWILQATHMDGKFFGYLIKPDQLQLIQQFMFLIYVFMCQYIIYPMLKKIFFLTPFRKMIIGGILGATSFVMSGILEVYLEPTYAVQPSTGLAQIRIFNTINCPINLSLEGQMQEVDSLDLYQNLNISVIGNRSLRFDVEVKCPNVTYSSFIGSIRAEEKKALTYILKNNSVEFGMIDRIEKSKSGDPIIRALILSDSEQPANLSSIRIYGKKNYQIDLTGGKYFTEFIEVLAGSYNISVDGIQMENEVNLRSGGNYGIIGKATKTSKVIKTVTIVEPNSIHMFWQLPQYLTLILSEVFVVVTVTEFALNEAPDSMKSVVIAETHLCSAIANLITIVIQKIIFFEREVYEYFLYAGLSYVAILVFGITAMSYKYNNSRTLDEK